MAKTFYVNYCDSINEPKVKAVMDTLAGIIRAENPDIIYFLFSSSGGLIEPGVALYNFLRSLPVELVMHNTGSIDSIANVIFLAGETRYAAVNSSFLFHGGTWTFPANTTLLRSQLAEVLSNLDSCETKISGIITERTKLTAPDMRALFSQGESKDAKFALDKGIISEIINPSIPKGAPIFSFNLP